MGETISHWIFIFMVSLNNACAKTVTGYVIAIFPFGEVAIDEGLGIHCPTDRKEIITKSCIADRL